MWNTKTLDNQIWIEYDNGQPECVLWEGSGWYASRQEGAHESQHIRTYHVGSDREETPETYTLGLGTPQWYDERPSDSHQAIASYHRYDAVVWLESTRHAGSLSQHRNIPAERSAK